jgi:mRNA interferase RelE/StbE
MGNYRIVIKKSAAKEIEKIQKQDRIRIVEKIRSLSSDPRPSGSKKLSGKEKYRIRQGNFRILYQVIDDALVINVVKVGHRRDIYKN